ncbi:DUF6170 family protein [Paraglaciecola hydrolytica]|uniref:Uncharacterized protein n=1 Tax=Paraglaciecola hydrolytica TaxID=1799789 RepID=A0A135ZYT3_9ALTE|nr:DUF6170 family protein [Paraglaciecola hydrolytica]KXI28142.1 hypothetical protein AX660_17305 [Paraglaciecola hydrolytica]
MKLYFSSKQIPQLQHLSLPQRLDALQTAQKKLTGPEKLLLNLLKLVMLVPVFVLILQVSNNWLALLWALLVSLLYPLIIKPMEFGLCIKYLSQSKPQGT